MQPSRERRRSYRFETAIPIHHRMNSSDHPGAATDELEVTGIVRNASLEGFLVDFRSDILGVCEVLSDIGKGPVAQLQLVADSRGGRLPFRGTVRWFQVGRPDGFVQNLRAGLCLQDPESSSAVRDILTLLTDVAIERREHSRVDVSRAALFSSGPYPRLKVASTVDLGVGGSKIETSDRLTLSQKLGITFSTVPPDVIKCKGEVVHIKQLADGKQQAGIRFVELPERQRLQLEQYVTALVRRREKEGNGEAAKRTNAEQRRHKRIPVDFSVVFHLLGSPVSGRAVNACHGGMMVRSYLPLKTAIRILNTLDRSQAHPVDMEFRLRRRYRAEAEIKHFHLEHLGEERCRTTMGLLMSKLKSHKEGSVDSSHPSRPILPNDPPVMDLQFLEDAKGVLKNGGRAFCMKCIEKDLARLDPLSDESPQREAGRVITETDLRTKESSYICHNCREQIR